MTMIDEMVALAAKENFDVCLIDDDHIYQFTARKMLESTGLARQIYSFYDGKAAIQYLQNEENISQNKVPDVIFLDINMPIMDGWQFLEAYKSLVGRFPRPVTVYMVSSSVDDYDIQRARQFEEVADYLIKPMQREKYRQLIDGLKRLSAN
jgi:CheY-like chemotaxis protein